MKEQNDNELMSEWIDTIVYSVKDHVELKEKNETYHLFKTSLKKPLTIIDEANKTYYLLR